jgi:hypothetical protein
MRLLRTLPVRHPEKKARRKIVFDVARPWPERLEAWDELIRMIDVDTEEFIAAAEESFKAMRGGKL